MISLRQLRKEDAPLMIEWMHDEDIQKGFKKNMLSATLEDAESFCMNAIIPKQISTGDNLHFAIVNDEDEYLGTISLKTVNIENGTAEYAITTRKKAQGYGIARKATYLILKKAFFEYKLHRVYLNVLADNFAAIRLYENCGFTLEGEFRDHLRIGGRYINWKWYGMLDSEFKEKNY